MFKLPYPGRCFLLTAMLAGPCLAEDRQFAGIVSTATPEASAAGTAILERGGNAIDAAVAISLALAVSEPAGSGIAGQTVMLVKVVGSNPQVIHGSTLSPAVLPEQVERAQLTHGHTASTVPSTLKVLDLAHRRFGSGKLSWAELVAPAIRLASQGVTVGPFRAKSLSRHGEQLAKNPAARDIFYPKGKAPKAGDMMHQPLLAATLGRIAAHGASDFYTGSLAAEIAEDMTVNGGWITAKDLAAFPDPLITGALQSSYRGYEVFTLPPPFGGWVVLQILNVLEQFPQSRLAEDDDERRLALLDAIRVGHGSRESDPVSDLRSFGADIASKTSKDTARRLLREYRGKTGGETTHFSVADADGNVVAVTQSIDSYFGAKVAHPTLGFLYNNYMQNFRLVDDGSPYVLKTREMPLSSMSATIVMRDEDVQLVLGSPGSARIISAVAQVTSHWIDVGVGIETAVAAFRVHSEPEDRAWVEGPELSNDLLRGVASRGFRLMRPDSSLSVGNLDPYFGGVHAVAFENGGWTGAADPRRDGRSIIAWQNRGSR